MRNPWRAVAWWLLFVFLAMFPLTWLLFAGIPREGDAFWFVMMLPTLTAMPLGTWLNFSGRSLGEVVRFFWGRLRKRLAERRMTREERSRARELDRLLREREEERERAADANRRLGEIERRLETLAGGDGPYRSAPKVRVADEVPTEAIRVGSLRLVAADDLPYDGIRRAMKIAEDG